MVSSSLVPRSTIKLIKLEFYSIFASFLFLVTEKFRKIQDFFLFDFLFTELSFLLLLDTHDQELNHDDTVSGVTTKHQ